MRKKSSEKKRCKSREVGKGTVVTRGPNAPHGSGLPVYKAIVGTVGTNISIQALGALSGVWVARMLGPEGRGELAVALFWPALFATLGVVGADVSLARFGARYPDSSANLRQQAIRVALMLGCMAIGICGAALPWLLPGKKAYLLPVSYLLLLSIPGAMVNLLLFSIELGRGQHRNYNLARLAFSIAYLVTLAIVAVRGNVEVADVGKAFVSTTVLSALFTLMLTKGSATRTKGGEVSAFSGWRVVREGLPFGVLTLLTSPSTQLPMLILVALAEVRAIGMYAVAYTVSALHQAVGGAVGKVLFGRSARGDESWTTERWLGTCRLTAGLYLLLAVMMSVALPALVPVVFGNEFHEAMVLVVFLVPATSFAAIAEVYDEILKGRGVWKAGLVARVAGGVALLLVAIPAVPELQSLGMVAAVAGGGIAQFWMLVILIAREFKAHWRDVLIMRPGELGLAFRR